MSESFVIFAVILFFVPLIDMSVSYFEVLGTDLVLEIDVKSIRRRRVEYISLGRGWTPYGANLEACHFCNYRNASWQPRCIWILCRGGIPHSLARMSWPAVA